MSPLDLPGFEEFLTLPTPIFLFYGGVNCGGNHISSENMPLSRAPTHPGRSRGNPASGIIWKCHNDGLCIEE